MTSRRAKRHRSTTGGWACGPTRRTGHRRTIWAFVMVLACSRHLFVWPTLRMDQQAWTEAHVEAFAFFDGVVRRVVPENVRRNIFRDQAARHPAEEPERLHVRLGPRGLVHRQHRPH